MAARFWVGGSGTWDNSSTSNWSATSGGAPGASVPNASDTVTFDSNSGTAATVTVAATAVSLNTTVNKSDIILSLSGSPTLVVSTQTLTLTTGTVVLNSYTLTIGRFLSQNTNVRTVDFGTGNITLTGSATTIWATIIATNLIFLGTPIVNATHSGASGTRVINGSSTSASTSNIASFNISAGTDTVTVANSFNNINFTGFSGTLNNSARTIYGNLTISSGMALTAGTSDTTFAATSGTQQITTNSKTLDFPLTFNGIGGAFAFQDALTQGSTRAFTITNGTVQLKNGVTSTVGSFVANNSSVKFLQSTTPGSQATLSQASGTVNVVDLTIRDINAVGGASWNAYTDFENTDAGNNDGWDFSLSPPYSTAELPITLRPFTQPRRF